MIGSDLKILINKRARMSPGKLAAQAVHAALTKYEIKHGSVIVLMASENKVKECSIVIKDAGKTELEPGTITAGI